MDRVVRPKISFVKLFSRPHEDRDSSTVFLDPLWHQTGEWRGAWLLGVIFAAACGGDPPTVFVERSQLTEARPSR
jgi:hypothetical protein